MMVRTLGIILLLVAFVGSGCSSQKRRSELNESLTVAVREKKISQAKMDTIVKELKYIEKEAPELARQYVEQMVGALEMGADSSHVDVMRRQIIKSVKKEKV